jgi:hypothetical protein
MRRGGGHKMDAAAMPMKLEPIRKNAVSHGTTSRWPQAFQIASVVNQVLLTGNKMTTLCHC